MRAMIEYRERHDLTQRGLASFLGITNKEVSRYETGVSTPSKVRRIKIERLTGGEIPADSWEGGKK